MPCAPWWPRPGCSHSWYTADNPSQYRLSPGPSCHSLPVIDCIICSEICPSRGRVPHPTDCGFGHWTCFGEWTLSNYDIHLSRAGAACGLLHSLALPSAVRTAGPHLRLGWPGIPHEVSQASQKSSAPLSPTESSGTQKIPAEAQPASNLWVTCTRNECLLSQATENDAKPKERA